MKKVNWKKFGGQFIEDEIDYIKKYLDYKDQFGNPIKASDVKISIGCDSKSKRRSITYAITIVFYSDIEHNGGHVIFKRFSVPKHVVYSGKKMNQWNGSYEENSAKKKLDIKEGDMSAIFNRLYNEADYLLELGQDVDKALKNIYFQKHEKNEYDDSLPYRLPELHLDLNPEAFKAGKHNKSNTVYNAVIGMLCGYGFKVIAKPNAYASTSCADLLSNK